jgi:hypothetical protein
MGTYAEIQTRVNRRVIDLPTQVVAEVPTLINEAIVDIQRDHNFKIMEAEFLGSTLVGTNTLGTIPSDFKEYRGQPYSNRNNGGTIKIRTTAKTQDLPPDIINSDIGQPQVIIQGATTFSVYPTADGASDYSDGEYPIIIPYWKYLPVLVSDSDHNWFTDNAERFIVEWVAAQAFGLDWDEEHMAILLQKAEGERKKIINQDKRFRLAGVTEFAYHKDAFGSNLRI